MVEWPNVYRSIWAYSPNTSIYLGSYLPNFGPYLWVIGGVAAAALVYVKVGRFGLTPG